MSVQDRSRFAAVRAVLLAYDPLGVARHVHDTVEYVVAVPGCFS
jgi:hypothetical protein